MKNTTIKDIKGKEYTVLSVDGDTIYAKKSKGTALQIGIINNGYFSNITTVWNTKV